MAHILVIDDEVEVTTFFKYFLQKMQHTVTVAHDTRQINDVIENDVFDLAIVDLKLPDTDGLAILKNIKKVQPSTQVIIMTGYSTVKTAVDAIHMGAYDYIEKPFDDILKLKQIIEQALHSQSLQTDELDMISEETGFIIGANQEMRRIIEIAKKVAPKNISILINGETGTGKEVFARFIHHISSRNNHPFIAVNCGAIAESLLESELFGHEKGSFTGASQVRKGVFEIANQGTLFLDEIGEASLQTQVKLLRVLELQEFMRVGGEKTIKTNTRILSATNVDLETAVQKKEFRSDLLYRLEGVKLCLPPLRERREDIPLLIQHFTKRMQKTSTFSPVFSPKAIEVLQNYQWPGNIRELHNVIMHTLALADKDSREIDIKHLPEKILDSVIKRHVPASADVSFEEKSLHTNNVTPLRKKSCTDDFSALADEFCSELLKKIEVENGFDLPNLLALIRDIETKVGHEVIKKALRQTMGNRKEAGRLLKINPRTLRYLLNEKGKSVPLGE
ncbi:MULTISPECIES: sigma-54-dependent transcriptional regulator [Aneurinibacillus]|jgi:two-component system NtrC family response regulator|uniref:Acetoacetate metabolism regulatory protein AtoC n=1 Tax=Aneurinibacillus danicus TaxID=267746 RepID=A0A511V3S4_9BACL|nr:MULTISPECIES: sigma-54 dependent transcriptional regulator [Aneurinibacillus]GEN33554.1 acetoacetate metabolism regulatory protein AtoC [Aneurinibacillus danicus]